MRLQNAKWEVRVRECEDQAQLAIEEREMQKAAALVAQDRRHDEALADVGQLRTVRCTLHAPRAHASK